MYIFCNFVGEVLIFLEQKNNHKILGRIGSNKERERYVEKVRRRARERGKDERKRDVLVSRYIYMRARGRPD
jgi:hypothetical protein